MAILSSNKRSIGFSTSPINQSNNIVLADTTNVASNELPLNQLINLTTFNKIKSIGFSTSPINQSNNIVLADTTNVVSNELPLNQLINLTTFNKIKFINLEQPIAFGSHTAQQANSFIINASSTPSVQSSTSSTFWTIG